MALPNTDDGQTQVPDEEPIGDRHDDGVGLLVTGRGRDESNALSTREWIEAANAICVDVKTDENTIPTPQTIEELTSEAQARADAFQAALESVNQLTQDFGLSDCLVEP